MSHSSLFELSPKHDANVDAKTRRSIVIGKYRSGKDRLSNESSEVGSEAERHSSAERRSSIQTPSSHNLPTIIISHKQEKDEQCANESDRKQLFRSYNQESRGIIPFPRAVYVFILLTLTLLLSYAPVVILTCGEFFQYKFERKTVFLRAMELLFFTHDVANPIILGLLNHSFRNEISEIMGFQLGTTHKSTSDHKEQEGFDFRHKS
ncbi:hypothetical protein ACOMHN_038244 [Nucella lapillus]